ncbi:MAG: hypothetical protein AAGL34_12925 [Bacteroidota bacterium]
MLRTLLFSTLFISQLVFSQDLQNHFLKNIYADYFELYRESIFVHTNKTQYLPGETVWFTAHFYDSQNDLPLLTNTNLHCSLFDANGKKLTSAVLSVDDGMASGNFKLPKDLKGQKIFLKSETAWMRNFIEDHASLVTLQIAQTEDTAIENIRENRKKERITLMPEGGHLVSNTPNTVGFIIQADDAVSDIQLLEERKNVVLSRISASSSGIGKFEFVPSSDKSYTVEVTFSDGRVQKAILPKAKPLGVALSTNSLFQDKVVLDIKTNNATLEQIGGRDYFVAIHRDGVLALKVLKMSQNQQSLAIPKNKLRSGMNIITIFDHDLNPILERLVFNDAQLKIAETTVKNEKKQQAKDSIRLKIQLYAKAHPQARMSVSVLPLGTASMNPEHSVLTQFLIAPYLKNSQADFKRYLDNLEDRVMQYQLDNVLLTHGWSRYDWSNIFTSPPEVLFEDNHGFSISGEIMNPTSVKSPGLLLYQKSNGKVYQTDIVDSGFTFHDVLINKDEAIQLTLLNKKNKTQEPKFSASVASLNFELDEVLSEDFLKRAAQYTENRYETEMEPEQINTANFFLDENTISLEGVTITEEKIEEKLVLRPQAATESIFNGLKITKEEAKLRPTLKLVLQNLGYRVWLSPSGEGAILPRTANPSIGAPVIVVDGIEMYNPSRNISNLPPDLLTSDTGGFDEIYYTHQAVEMGNRPVIYIYRKYGASVGEKPEERFATFIANEGFQRPSEFVNPEYVSYTNDDFQSHGTIHWANQVVTNTEGEAFVTIPTLQQEGASIYIEGIAEDGSLISEVKSVSFQ